MLVDGAFDSFGAIIAFANFTAAISAHFRWNLDDRAIIVLTIVIFAKTIAAVASIEIANKILARQGCAVGMAVEPVLPGAACAISAAGSASLAIVAFVQGNARACGMVVIGTTPAIHQPARVIAIEANVSFGGIVRAASAWIVGGAGPAASLNAFIDDARAAKAATALRCTIWIWGCRPIEARRLWMHLIFVAFAHLVA